MTDPLRISVEIADEISDAPASCIHEAVAYVDSRVRPLVDSLRFARGILSAVSMMRPDWIGSQQAIDRIDAALKAAGAE